MQIIKLSGLFLSVLMLLACAQDNTVTATRAKKNSDDYQKPSLESLCQPDESNASEFLKSRVRNSIVGGKTLSAQNIVAEKVALLLVKDRNLTNYCTATVISDDLLLTAAHCLQGATADMRVIFSNNYLCATEDKLAKSVYGVKQYKIHENFEKDGLKDLENDIALVQIQGIKPSLGKAIDIKTVVPIRNQDQLLMVGYGVMSHQGDGVGRLRILGKSGNSQVNPTEKFRGHYIEQTTKGICGGDSGGPLLRVTDQGLEMIGIASAIIRDPEEARCKGTSYFVDINLHIEWIATTKTKLQNQN
ncbi:MAG: S1 family peptidase [Bdellovibrionia bacterium]